MAFLNRYFTLITVALVLLGIASGFFYNETLGYFLFATAFILTGIRLALIQRQIKIMTNRFFAGMQKSGAEAIQSATQLLESREVQFKNIVFAIKKIQEGKLDENVTAQLDGDAQLAITDLQTNLVSMKEQEAKQNWVVKGIAKMGEIRKSNSSLEEYSYQITSTLIKYLEANQGAFYMLNQEEGVLQMLSSYAYGKRKFTDGRVTVPVGSGLLGQSVMDRELIFMTQVPSDYVKITSGLGEAKPRCITIAPLIFREQVYGVIEIASFQILKKHHLEFVKEVSESVSSELADILRQENTAQLLKQSQQQAQELKSQEEELRQNMEEMQATQEEMKRKEKSLLQHMTDLTKAQDDLKMQEAELKAQLTKC